MTGNTLREIPMSAGCDTVDLLGGFEQVEDAAGEFRWNDSVLVRGMEEGHWVVLDTANFCSPSVLDRLNPVVEPHGVLVLNEQGLVEGQVRIVQPHPNFRLFATMDPKHGEVSRAMRNRAIEIYCPPPALTSVDLRVLVNSRLMQGHAPADVAVAHNVADALIQHHAGVLELLHGVSAHADVGRHADVLASGALSLRSMLRVVDMLQAGFDSVDPLRAALQHQYHRNRAWVSPLAVEVADIVLARFAVPRVLRSSFSNTWALPPMGAQPLQSQF